MTKTGRYAIIEQFLEDGIKYMFGNPGTVEQGFLDVLDDYPEMEYISTLQESIAVMLADGYARATKETALVQIHSTPGLGNSIGALYQAYRGHSPLVVIGGDAGLKYMPMEAQMYGELVDFAEPVTKWSTMVKDHRSLLRVLRRAIKIASTPPTGPVYVCLPADVLDKPAVEEIRPTSIPSTRSYPEPDLIEQAAQMLVNSEKPMFFIGNGVAYSKAQDEVAEIAELLGAEVWGVDSGELNLPHNHPLYMGQTGHMFGEDSLPITQKGDVNLICGTYMMPEVFPELGNIFSEEAQNIHIDLNDYSIAKNHPVDLGIVSDPKLSLQKLIDELKNIITRDIKEAAADRIEEIKQKNDSNREEALKKDQKLIKNNPITAAGFMKELEQQTPDDVMIFDEALTSSPEVTRYLTPKYKDHYFQSRGGSLGVGIPGALGIKLSNPDKTVIGFTGDGGSMYTIQALWTAARYNIDANFVICNNGSYKLLEMNLKEYRKELDIKKEDCPSCFDLTEPRIAFTNLAESMQVKATQVTRHEEISETITQMLETDGPFLIDLILPQKS